MDNVENASLKGLFSLSSCLGRITLVLSFKFIYTLFAHKRALDKLEEYTLRLHQIRKLNDESKDNVNQMGQIFSVDYAYSYSKLFSPK